MVKKSHVIEKKDYFGYNLELQQESLQPKPMQTGV